MTKISNKRRIIVATMKIMNIKKSAAILVAVLVCVVMAMAFSMSKAPVARAMDWSEWYCNVTYENHPTYSVPVRAIGDTIDTYNSLGVEEYQTDNVFADASFDNRVKLEHIGDVKTLEINPCTHMIKSWNLHVGSYHFSRFFGQKKAFKEGNVSDTMMSINHIDVKYRGKSNDSALFIYFNNGSVWNNGDDWGTWNVPVTPTDLYAKEKKLETSIIMDSTFSVTLCDKEFAVVGIWDSKKSILAGATKEDGKISLLPVADSYSSAESASFKYEDSLTENHLKGIGTPYCMVNLGLNLKGSLLTAYEAEELPNSAKPYPKEWWTSTIDHFTTGTTQGNTHAFYKTIKAEGAGSNKIQTELAAVRPLYQVEIDDTIFKYLGLN